MNMLIMKFPFASRFGGGEKHTLDVAIALRQRGFRVHFVGSCRVLRTEMRKQGFATQLFWAGVEPVTPLAAILFLPWAPVAFLLLACALLYYRIVRKVRILYCLSLTEKLLMPLFARMLGMRVFFMEHRLIDRWLTMNPWRFLYAFQTRIARVVTISQAVATQLAEIGVSSSRIHVISIGVDLAMFPWPRNRDLRPGAYVIGTVAGLEPGKGIAYLVKAVQEARENIPNLRAIVVGAGPERQKLTWLADRLGLREVMQWVGFQRDVYRWYAHFDIFVLPSIKPESFGMVVIEAMASGVPVIATQLGGVPEIITHGVNGFLVNPTDAHAIAERVIDLYHHRDVARRVADAGRKTVEERYRHDAMIRAFIRLFESS